MLRFVLHKSLKFLYALTRDTTKEDVGLLYCGSAVKGDGGLLYVSKRVVWCGLLTEMCIVIFLKKNCGEIASRFYTASRDCTFRLFC